MSMDSMRNVEKSIGESISAVRKMRKLTQKAFAELLTSRGLPVDASAVSRMEKGERALRIAECLVVAEVLDVELSFLLRGIETPEQEIRANRKFVDMSMQEAGEPIWYWLGGLLGIKWQIGKNPELAKEIDPSIGTESEYLPWVANRLQNLVWERGSSDPGGDLIETRDQGEVDALLACLMAYGKSRIVVDKELQYGVDPETS